MNLEQMQLLVNMLQGIGVEAKTVILTYIFLDRIPNTVALLTLIILAFILARRFLGFFATEHKLEILRDLVHPGRFSGQLTDFEWNATISKIRELKEKAQSANVPTGCQGKGESSS